MRRALALLVLLAALGALGWWFTRPPTAPEPLRYTVARGDTLGRIARAHGVEVAQLRSWNGIQGDLIEVGQVLLIHTPELPASSPPPPKTRRKGPRVQGSVSAAGPAPASALRLPPAQPCLAGPTDVDAEQGMAASAGLDYSQVKAAMDGFIQNTARCLPPEGATGTLTLTLTVACTGRVAAVAVQDDGGLDAGLVSCVQEVLGYTPFPAHDMPDGYEFGYPLRFEGP